MTFFPTNAQIRQWVKTQSEVHKDVLELFNLGFTYGGQEIQGLSIGDKTKPMFYMHCTIHAREWIATTSCLWIIDQLLNEAENRQLRNDFHWVIVPVHNVDGYDYTRSGDRLWRKNRQPNSGTTCVGTDCNRNYGFQWGGAGASSSPCSETYRGSAKWSSPEAKAEDTWLAPHIARRNVKAYVDIHAYGGYVLSSWGYTTRLTPADYPEMDRNMRLMVAAIRAVNGNTYTFGQSGITLYETSGSTVDDLYGAGKVVNAYTIECAGNNFTPPASSIPVVGREVWAGIKALAKALA